MRWELRQCGANRAGPFTARMGELSRSPNMPRLPRAQAQQPGAQGAGQDRAASVKAEVGRGALMSMQDPTYQRPHSCVWCGDTCGLHRDDCAELTAQDFPELSHNGEYPIYQIGGYTSGYDPANLIRGKTRYAHMRR